LDLVGLRHGYGSQEATVRAAILSQFNNIQLGFLDVRDVGNYYRPGFQVWTDIPIFDRNQGNIVSERATRQKLFDEYVSRVFQARNDIATLLVGIRWLNDQVRNAQEAKPILTRLVDKLRSALSGGQATVVLYYTALIDLTAKRIQILALQQQLVDAMIALELATGLYELDGPVTVPEVSTLPRLGVTP
ncbi:MAG: TolC family protein, partial [Nitrospirota bacterium]|nr:TolC family protein [Nitrospirota bacterium]